MRNNVQRYMQIAIQEARKSSEPLKCGSVIVLESKILAKAHNSQRKDSDISSHAEIKAIRKANKKLKNKNLYGATIISTCEPCQMCLSAIQFAKIEQVIFAASLKTVANDTDSKTTKIDQAEDSVVKEVIAKLYS